jgi:membrane-associated phospholipid phosphatase
MSGRNSRECGTVLRLAGNIARKASTISLVVGLVSGSAAVGWAQSADSAMPSLNFSGVGLSPPSFSLLGNEVSSDFAYLVDNVQLDAEDIVTSPLYIASPNSVFRSRKFYLALAGVGAIWGGAFALDQTMRSHLRSMGHNNATMLQDISYGSVSAATGLLYAYGLYRNDSQARQLALTAGEAAGVATLLDIGIKAAFGRLRPRQDGHSHTQFFDHGASFVSGDVTPMFALATGVSEYFNNEWYASVPIYSLALLDGFGRMGNDAHWFSDVVGAALLGSLSTELFIYLHKRHEEEPSRWRILPYTPPPVPTGRTTMQNMMPTGLEVAYSW